MSKTTKLRAVSIRVPDSVADFPPVYANAFHVNFNGTDLSIVAMRVPILPEELAARVEQIGSITGTVVGVTTMTPERARDLAEMILKMTQVRT